MKKHFSLVLVALLVLCAVVLTGCKKESVETEGKGYGIVHGDYVGVATLKVKDEVVTSAKFEEYFLPTHWAVVTGDVDSSLVVAVEGKHGTSNVAKYIKVGDKTFTANAEGVYSADGIADLKAWIDTNQDNAKWYAEALAAGNAKAVDASGTELTATYAAKSEGFAKNETNYWPASYGSGLGWSVNMKALETAIVGTKVNLEESQLTQNTETGIWTFGTTVTTATLTDAKDYYAVAKLAYAAATK